MEGEASPELKLEGDIPARYVMPQQDRPSAAAGVAPIPVIDLGRLSRPDADGGAVEEEAKLRWALETWGFFMITNHGIEASLMDWMMNASKEFFGQPTEEKQTYNNIIDGKRFRLEGYRNHFYRDVLLQYASRTKIIKDCIMGALANLLELDEDYFINRTTTRARALARLGYYPPCPRPDLVSGFKPHYDGGALSILFVEENVGGLQVLRNGKWYNILAKPYTLLINIAECIEE
ncbi:oxoglutarate-dependent flavonoid 7-O-demethylase 1-like [Aegilops tauschii subsp. strangulata]|uniref:oxoglutarate-dependent flavonoid 7-O-demethylase 1-like n=1 Tax=Aegilops tauschii subsp. strangulata TaxID=200361 RepID=UPI003CC87CA1